MSGKQKTEGGRWVRIPPGANLDEPLEPMFGPSCKPYKLLKCSDVHGCVHCKAQGCQKCGFTGVGPIPFGVRFCCGVCWGSGKDHLRRYQNVEPPPDPPAMPEDPPKPETRKERRSKNHNL